MYNIILKLLTEHKSDFPSYNPYKLSLKSKHTKSHNSISSKQSYKVKVSCFFKQDSTVSVSVPTRCGSYTLLFVLMLCRIEEKRNNFFNKNFSFIQKIKSISSSFYIHNIHFPIIIIGSFFIML